ncbi:MAG: serine/threonine-protein kinase [Cyanobacteriota bacterium]|nr:serine/threonine-protein kinase [Cyanobacteriota bacterium]
MVWQDGQTLQNGKYRIVGEPLGWGAFAITHKALHVPLNEEVVIKTPDKYLKTDPKYSKYIERFIQEGQKLAKLSRNAHPNIVRVRDSFQEGEVHGLVMDFVPGENLFQVVKRRGRLSEAEAISYFQQIGDALATMHEAGLVHRDAHPGNIILRGDGRAILIDFGIAQEVIPATLSSTGEAGNKGFAPYEQLFRGSRKPNADVYCLAATLYYTVTGQCPTRSLERKLHDVPLIPPQQLVSSISQGLNKAILMGMELEAEDRPQSMRQWLKELILKKQPQPTPRLVRELKVEVRETLHREKSKEGKTKIIPWGWLVGMLSFYGIQGFVLAGAGAGIVAGAWAVAWAEACTEAWDVVWVVAGIVAGIVAGVVAVAGSVAEAVAGAVVGAATGIVVGTAAGIVAGAGSAPGIVVGTGAGAGAVVVAVTEAGAVAGAVVGVVALVGAVVDVKEELLKSFNRSHIFLILAK